MTQEEAIRWIGDRQSLATELERLHGPLAVDSEADSLHHYPEKVCLIQLSFAGRDLLVDPLSGIDLEPLGQRLARPDVLKLLHGADYDLRMLHRDFGLRVQGLFDTMVAARLVGERSFGLAALLERHFDVRLDKKHQRADWSRRPLPEAMARYAAMDTRYLERLADRLQRRLAELGRESWAAEEFRRLERVEWNSAPRAAAYRRVRGSAKLDRRGLAILRELTSFRELEARRRDRPPFKILPDAALLALARERPRNDEQLRAVEGLPESWQRGNRSRTLVEAIETALDLGESDLPERATTARPERDPAFETRARALLKRRDGLATELDLESSVLAPRGQVEGLLRCLDAGLDPSSLPDLRRWQLELLLPLAVAV